MERISLHQALQGISMRLCSPVMSALYEGTTYVIVLICVAYEIIELIFMHLKTEIGEDVVEQNKVKEKVLFSDNGCVHNMPRSKSDMKESRSKDKSEDEGFKTSPSTVSHCRNNFPLVLHNQKGYICLILSKKYILTYINGSPLLVKMKVEDHFKDLVPFDFISTNIIWTSSHNLLSEYVPDGFEVLFDAVVIPNTVSYLALIIWTNNKPQCIPLPYPGAYYHVVDYRNVPARIIFRDNASLYIDLQVGTSVYKTIYPIDRFIHVNFGVPYEIALLNKMMLIPILADVSQFWGFVSENRQPTSLFICNSLRIPVSPANNSSVPYSHYSYNKVFTTVNFIDMHESNVHQLYIDVKVQICCEKEILVLNAFLSETEIEGRLPRLVNGKTIEEFDNVICTQGHVHTHIQKNGNIDHTLVMLHNDGLEWVNWIRNVKLIAKVQEAPSLFDEEKGLNLSSKCEVEEVKHKGKFHWETNAEKTTHISNETIKSEEKKCNLVFERKVQSEEASSLISEEIQNEETEEIAEQNFSLACEGKMQSEEGCDEYRQNEDEGDCDDESLEACKCFEEGCVKRVSEASLTLENELVVRRDQCHLLGISIASYDLRKVVRPGLCVQYQLESREVKKVKYCWVGGKPNVDPFLNFENMLMLCISEKIDEDTMNSLINWMEGGLTLAWIARGTSPVDWCEDNYTVTPHIAEFSNTVSNVLFLLVPGLFSRLWTSYASHVSRGIHVVWVFFTVIGLSSAYFHATLSLLGQLLDELSILWVLVLSYSLFTPVRHRPTYLQTRPLLYKGIFALLGVLITAFAFIKPEINQYALFVAGAPALWMCAKEVLWCREAKVSCLGLASLSTFVFAAAVWVSDRFLCSELRKFNLTMLHGLWHLLIFASSYIMQVLFCYFYAKQDVPESKPVLRFWPGRTWGLPYILCKSNHAFKCP